MTTDREVLLEGFHFFASNFKEWKVNSNIHEVTKWMNKQKWEYELWYVPLPHDSKYPINLYSPQVKNAVYLGRYKQGIQT